MDQLHLFAPAAVAPALVDHQPLPARVQPGYVDWHGVACHHESEYSVRCSVAFVVGVFLLRGRPRVDVRAAHRAFASEPRRR